MGEISEDVELVQGQPGVNQGHSQKTKNYQNAFLFRILSGDIFYSLYIIDYTL